MTKEDLKKRREELDRKLAESVFNVFIKPELEIMMSDKEPIYKQISKLNNK